MEILYISFHSNSNSNSFVAQGITTPAQSTSQGGLPLVPTNVGAPTRSLVSDLDKLFHTNPITATAEWLKRQSSSAPTPTTSSSTPTQPQPTNSGATPAFTTKDMPVPGDFLVPTNLIEHNLIVARLISGGSLPAEAEQTIASRKAAFNKALCEYKKENPNQNNNRASKQGKQSKTNQVQNVN